MFIPFLMFEKLSICTSRYSVSSNQPPISHLTFQDVPYCLNNAFTTIFENRLSLIIQSVHMQMKVCCLYRLTALRSFTFLWRTMALPLTMETIRQQPPRNSNQVPQRKIAAFLRITFRYVNQV